jgi:WD40 repeat protein
MNDRSAAHPSRDQLEAFGLGRALPEDALAVHRHLEECADCRTVVESLADDTLSSLVRLAVAPRSTQPSAGPGPADEAGPLADHPRYRTLERIGAGGMGVVYKAQHLVMGRIVALKVIHPALTERPAMVERFRREVQAAAGLCHPNVVTAYDADQAGDRHFLVMEYVPGITLDRLVREQGPLPPERACEYTRQAALGLQHAHDKGLVHRDVKPANLILTPEGQVKVLDFGLARCGCGEEGREGSGSITGTGTFMGTVDFLAPEQADDPHRADIRADLYSLGCTLYFLLTGQPPFPEGTLMQRLKAHALREPPPLAAARPGPPAGLEAVVRRLLAKEPARRFQTPAEVARALAPFAERRPQRRRPLRRAVLAAALLAVVALLGGAVYRIATDHGELEIVTNDPDVEVVLQRNGEAVRIIDLRTRQAVTLRSGEYAVKVDGKGGEVEVQPGRVVMKRGDKVTVTIRRGLVLEKQFEGPRHVGELAFSADGKFALIGHDAPQNHSIALWDLTRGVKVRVFQGHSSNIHDLTFTKDAKRFLSCGRDKTVRLWDVTTGKEIRQYAGHEGEVWSARLSPDSRSVLTGCHDKKLRLFDLETGAEKKALTGHDGKVICVAFAPDGRRALSCAEDKTVRLWDLDKGQEVRSWTTEHIMRRVAWSADGQRFLSCGDSGKVLLWDLSKSEPTLSFDGYERIVYQVGFTSDGRFVVACGHDGTVRFWDWKTGREVFHHNEGLGEIYSIQISRDGRRLLSSGGFNSNAARLYRLPQGLWPAAK